VLAIVTLLTALSAPTVTPPPRRSAAPHAATACALVTRSDIEQTLGAAVGPAEGDVQGRLSTCDFTGSRGMVSVSLQRLASAPDLEVEIASLKKEVPEGVARPAAGFEAGSFFFDIPGAGAQLHVLVGGRHLMVSILGFGEARDVSRAAERLARKAIARF
jgi:hypothetical protein